MTAPTPQPPPPGRHSARNPDNEPTVQYGVPTQQPYDAPPQQPYYEQPPRQPQYGGEPTQPLHHGQPPMFPQYAGQSEAQPRHGRPPTQPQYGQPPGQLQYGQPPGQPPYGQPPAQPPYGGQPAAYYGPPQRRSKAGWLLAAAIAVVVALVASAGVFVVTRSGEGNSAQSPLPTATYSDGLSTPESSPSPTEVPSSTPSKPVPTPSPTPTERRRTLKDVDKGIRVYDDVYVNPTTGWRKDRRTTYSLDLVSDTKPGVVIVFVSPIGYPATKAVKSITRQLVEADRLTAVRMDPVKSLSPANSNIGSQAQMGFSGRYAKNGVVISVVGRCTTMTGFESIHNVTVTVCVEARKDYWGVVLRDANRMLVSVARSI